MVPAAVALSLSPAQACCCKCKVEPFACVVLGYRLQALAGGRCVAGAGCWPQAGGGGRWPASAGADCYRARALAATVRAARLSLHSAGSRLQNHGDTKVFKHWRFHAYSHLCVFLLAPQAHSALRLTCHAAVGCRMVWRAAPVRNNGNLFPECLGQQCMGKIKWSRTFINNCGSFREQIAFGIAGIRAVR